MAKFYTRTGDAGQTSLYSGERVDKDGLRVETYGTVDELSAALGLARAASKRENINATILNLQEKLMAAMADFATLGAAPRITAADVSEIESEIDVYSDALPEGFKWTFPGESQVSAALHVARTIARRAERLAIALNRTEPIDENLLKYLNRISDLCYAMARYVDEVPDHG